MGATLIVIAILIVIAVLSVERFGASTPAEVLLREYGFTVDNVCARAVALRIG